jgi:hypothetical protein
MNKMPIYGEGKEQATLLGLGQHMLLNLMMMATFILIPILVVF